MLQNSKETLNTENKEHLSVAKFFLTLINQDKKLKMGSRKQNDTESLKIKQQAKACKHNQKKSRINKLKLNIKSRTLNIKH